jgi:uncharacterized protein DUF4238
MTPRFEVARRRDFRCSIVAIWSRMFEPTDGSEQVVRKFVECGRVRIAARLLDSILKIHPRPLGCEAFRYNRVVARAHVTPRTYLKGFARTKSPPKGVVVYDRLSPFSEQVSAPRVTDVRRVSTIDDFYVLRRASGPDPSLEQAFCEIEQSWGNVRAALNRGGPFSEDEWGALLVFAAAQEARVFRVRMMLARPLQELLPALEQACRNAGVSEDEVEAAKAACIDRHRKAAASDMEQDPANISLETLPTFIQQNLTLFSSMQRTIVTARSGDFLTSDNPVLWFDPAKSEQNPCPNKLSLTAEVTFPLTKRHCLVMAYLPLKQQAEADDDIVHIINSRTATYALGEVYGLPALSQAAKERHLHHLTDRAWLRAPLVQRYVDVNGSRSNMRALTQALGASPELFLSGNAHLAPVSELLRFVS